MSGTELATGNRADIEARVLVAALKLSFEQGDSTGASLVYRALGNIMQGNARTSSVDDSTLPQEQSVQSETAVRQSAGIETDIVEAPESVEPPDQNHVGTGAPAPDQNHVGTGAPACPPTQ